MRGFKGILDPEVDEMVKTKKKKKCKVSAIYVNVMDDTFCVNTELEWQLNYVFQWQEMDFSFLLVKIVKISQNLESITSQKPLVNKSIKHGGRQSHNSETKDLFEISSNPSFLSAY